MKISSERNLFHFRGRMKLIRYLFILSFFVTALYHLKLAIYPLLGDDSSVERHFVFVAISLSATGLFLLNKAKPLLLFVPLIMQQVYSHGMFLVTEWNEGRIDWPSILVLISMPLLTYYVFKRNAQRV